MKYILGFFVTILLLILVVVLIFSGGGEDQKPVPNTSKALPEYSSSQSAASLTIAGPVNYHQDHRVTKVTVSRDTVTLEQIRGYDGQVIDIKTFPNTEPAYAAFLSSLDQAGFTKGDTSEALKKDIGRCPLGTRYIYEFQDGSERLQRFWSSTCTKQQNYLGDESLTIKLFKKQVPNYDRLNRDFLSSLTRQ